MVDSAGVQALLRRATAVIIGCLLAVALTTSLLLSGLYLLLRAMYLGLTPLLGEAGAMAVTGAVCLGLVGCVLYFLGRPARSSSRRSGGSSASGSSPASQLRRIIRENPLESAMTAFALGVVEQSDPRLRALLLQGGIDLMKQADADHGGDEPREEAAAAD